MLLNIHAFLESGGLVLYGLLAVAITMLTFIFERYWFYKMHGRAFCLVYLERWQTLSNHYNWQASKLRQQYISMVVVEFQRHRATIKMLVLICPLFGLLGTVVGMVSVFDVMAVSGTGNARAMSAGIAQATIPTMAGMVISLIGLYFDSRFESISKGQLNAFQDKLIRVAR